MLAYPVLAWLQGLIAFLVPVLGFGAWEAFVGIFFLTVLEVIHTVSIGKAMVVSTGADSML